MHEVFRIHEQRKLFILVLILVFIENRLVGVVFVIRFDWICKIYADFPISDWRSLIATIGAHFTEPQQKLECSADSTVWLSIVRIRAWSLRCWSVQNSEHSASSNFTRWRSIAVSLHLKWIQTFQMDFPLETWIIKFNNLET